jgi:hypothetical protein
MRRKEMEARIAELERENRDLMDKIGGLYKADYDKTIRVKDLKEELIAEKEKYAALLERHISMMGKMARFKVEGGE